MQECLGLATLAGSVERRPLVVTIKRVERLRREFQPVPIVRKQALLQLVASAYAVGVDGDIHGQRWVLGELGEHS